MAASEVALNMMDTLRFITRKLYSSAHTVRLRNTLRRIDRFRPPADHGDFDVVLNFPDGIINLYQVRQWYGPLEHLSKTRRVAILCYRPEAAQQIAEETDLKVVLTPSFSDLTEVKHELRPKVILYPNQNYANYRILGLNSAVHVFICHGESDKIYMASNWVKVFNYFFVAGQASRNRLAHHVRNYDPDARTIEIGRPQIDQVHRAPIAKHPDRIAVLYAPTWEGGRRSMKYGSVASHGVKFVSALLSDCRFQVIYRPHPRTGIHDAEFARADAEIRGLIARQNADPEHSGHFIDDTAFGWQLDLADVMIADISAVAYDWLTTAKPLLATKPEEPAAILPAEGFMVDTPLVEAKDADHIVEIIDRTMSDGERNRALQRWADFYYGDRTPGASLHRFTSAIDRVIAERETALADGGRQPSLSIGSDPGMQAPAGTQRTIGSSLKTKSRATRWARYLEVATTNIANVVSRARSQRLAEASGSDLPPVRPAEILVTSMAEPDEIDNLIDWLPALRILNSSHSVALLVGNRRTYDKLREHTDLRIHLGFNATQTEQIVVALDPTISLQFEQSNLNLRETTHRKTSHIYVGSRLNSDWINNRLRLFDSIVVPDRSDIAVIASAIIDFPRSTSLIVADGGPSTDQSRVHAIESIIADRCRGTEETTDEAERIRPS